MLEDTPVRRLLDRLGEGAVVGVLVLVAALPLLTGFAALSAGIAAVQDPDAAGTIGRRYLAALRHRPGRALAVQAGWLLAVAVAAADLRFAAGAGGPVRVPVLAMGSLFAAAAVLTPPFLCARLADPAGSARAVALDGLVLAASAPLPAVALGAAALVAGFTCFVVPAATPLAVGAYTVCAAATCRNALARAQALRLPSSPVKGPA